MSENLKLKKITFKKSTNDFFAVLTDGIDDIMNIIIKNNSTEYVILNQEIYNEYKHYLTEDFLNNIINIYRYDYWIKRNQNLYVIVGVENDINFKTYKFKHDYKIKNLSECEYNYEHKTVLQNYINQVIKYKIKTGEKILNKNLDFLNINI